MRAFLTTRLQPLWQARSQREQRLLLVMGLVLSMSIVCFGVLVPLTDVARSSREAVLQLEADVAYVASLADEVAKLKGKPTPTPLKANDLVSLLHQAMLASGFAHTGVSLVADGDVAVHMKGEADFDAWIMLLAQLAQHYQVQLVRMSINPTTTPGNVVLDALLVHAGGVA